MTVTGSGSGFDLGSFLTTMWVTLLALVVLMGVTCAIGVRLRRHNVVDVTWGLGFALAALAAFAVSAGHGDVGRRVLVTVLTLIWGLRLAAYMAVRSRAKGEDPRYAAMLDKKPGNRTVNAFRSIYLTQALALWFVSLPLQVTMSSGAGLDWLSWVGVLLWLVGAFFESVGDLQLARFKADPANKGVVMNRGLWRYTRHPNYFGDACVWWGLFLVAASSWPGVLTIVSPVAMTYFLVRGTGKKVLEGHMAERPGFADYVRRTSGFLPLPPRSSRSEQPA